MISALSKTRTPCVVCTKRKVKCDRNIPCSNCVKRGQQELCIASERTKLDRSSRSPPLERGKLDFQLMWHAYGHWVVELGIFQNDLLAHDVWEDRINSNELTLSHDNSFKLLDFAAENLGPLFFGIVSDVSDLYFKLEEHWFGPKTGDSLFTEAVLSSIFTLAIFYMPLEALTEIAGDSQEWNNQRRMRLYTQYCNETIGLLHQAQFLSKPDIRTLQTYLILASTPFPTLKPSLANSILTQCLHLAKYWEINQFRPLVTDAPDLILTKLACEKLWYRLSVHDYWQSGPNKPLSIHDDNLSLLTHAAFLMDRPSVDVYQSEDTFEALLWKIVSLDRDLQRYFATQTKPPLKTLDAIGRQLEIFGHKTRSIDVQSSKNARLEHFIATFLLNFVSWKLTNLSFTYYDQRAGADKLNQATTLLLAQVLQNTQNRVSFYNQIPMVPRILAKIMTFHSMCFIYDTSAVNEQLLLDLLEVVTGFDAAVDPLIAASIAVTRRLKKLGPLWRTVRVVDNESSQTHPVFKILHDDIQLLKSRYCNRLPIAFGAAPFTSDPDKEEQSQEFQQIVKDFQMSFSLNDLLNLPV